MLVDEISNQKAKASMLIPGASTLGILEDGDDIIQTHVESGEEPQRLSQSIQRFFSEGN